MLTIGLIDNYVIMRMGLAIILKDHFKDVDIVESDSLAEFEKIYPGKKPDVLILGNNGDTSKECLDTAQACKKYFGAVPIIIYDEHLEQNLTISYFNLGISGYILKQNNAREMINCVESVMNKQQYLCPVLLAKLLKFVAKTTNGIVKDGLLTPRESEIAKYLTEGLKTSAIAKVLDRKPSTISTIKNRIFRKMKVENVVQLRGALPLGNF